MSNFRPISNLNTISKILERLFLVRLRLHVAKSGNFNPMQSGFRTGHSTETALQFILNDVYRSMDETKLTILVALDISAAFDTLEHAILIRRLDRTLSIFNTIFVSSHMYPENPEETQVIVSSMNIGYISDTARNRTHNLFRPKRESIPLGHSDGHFRFGFNMNSVLPIGQNSVREDWRCALR